ncbi:MAG: type IV secretory system conjugative DNA transfer family protein, partial [Catonella sp.]
MNNNWLEVIYYTIIQLAKVNQFNLLIILAFFGYLLFQVFKWQRPSIRRSFKRFKEVYQDRAILKIRIVQKWSRFKAIVTGEEKFDRKTFLNSILAFMKRLVEIIPAFTFLLFGNLLFRIVYRLPFVKQERKRFDKEMKPILYFNSYRSLVLMGFGFSLIAFMITNYGVTVLRAAIRYLYFAVMTLKDNSQMVEFDTDSLLIQNLLNVRVFVLAPILAFPLLIVGLIIAWKSAWVNFEQYRSYNNNEEGDDRFATVKEIHQQYKKVPNKTTTFPGEGGVPVLHETRNNLTGLTLGSQMLWQNRKFSRLLTKSERVLGMLATPSGDYYIEDATTNMLGVGITRSGKGEGHIAVTMDINSRAAIQPSMIIADPKGEHYQSSYKTMRRRGYNVNVLSFQNMDWSMSYNPLALAIAAARKGYYEKTQTRVNAVAEAIYRKTKPGTGNGNAKYWEDTSISLFNAIAMALIDRASETFKNGESDAWDTVTVRNVAKFLTDLGSEEVFVDDLGEVIENPGKDQAVKKKSKITVYFDNLRSINQRQFSKFREMADLNFRSSDFAAEETKGNVYSSMMSGINLF